MAKERDKQAEAALISAIRLWRYWVRQGVDERIAFANALKQAIGMLRASGKSPDVLLEELQDLKTACNSFIRKLEELCKQK